MTPQWTIGKSCCLWYPWASIEAEALPSQIYTVAPWRSSTGTLTLYLLLGLSCCPEPLNFASSMPPKRAPCRHQLYCQLLLQVPDVTPTSWTITMSPHVLILKKHVLLVLVSCRRFPIGGLSFDSHLHAPLPLLFSARLTSTHRLLAKMSRTALNALQSLCFILTPPQSTFLSVFLSPKLSQECPLRSSYSAWGLQ